MRELSHFPLECPTERIKRRLKIPKSSTIKEYDALIEQYFTLVEPVARFKTMAIGVRESAVKFEDGYHIESNDFCRFVEGCNRATILGVTIGPFLEEEIDKYNSKKRALEPLILDAVGSESAEEAANYVSSLIQIDIKKSGASPTKRFSPGYGDLHLGVQRWVFKTLQLTEIGIKLNDSFLMIPQKSITAFIGWQRP